MAGYIGSKASVVSSGAENKKIFTITGATTSLTGLNYPVGKVHVFQNGVRLVDGTDYTATNGTTITLTVAAQSGDNVVVISQAAFQVAGAVSTSGDSMTGNLSLGDNNKAIFGVGSNLEIYANGGHSYIDEVGANNLNIRTNGADIGIYDTANSQYMARFATSGNVRLYHNGSQKLATTSTGIDVTGTATMDGLTVETSADPALITLRHTGNTSGLIIKNFSGGEAQLVNVDNGPMVFKTNDTERMRIDSSGKVIIGTEPDDTYSNGWSSTGGVQDSSRDSTAARDHYTFRNANGQVGFIQTSGSATSYNTSSDYRLKENVVDLTGASARVNQLDVKRFNFISDDTNTLVDGFLAHEVADVVPEAITGTKDAMKDEEYEVTPAVLDEDGNVTTEAVMGTRSVPDYQGIDQSKLVPLLTAALQEALTEIASLKTRVEALEA